MVVGVPGGRVTSVSVKICSRQAICSLTVCECRHAGWIAAVVHLCTGQSLVQQSLASIAELLKHVAHGKHLPRV